MNPTYTDNFEDLVEFRAQMIVLMYTEGKNERGGAMLQELARDYRRTDGTPNELYYAVKARIAELLR